LPLLPSTDWDGKCVGIRVTFEPKDRYELVHRFRQLGEKGKAAALALAEKVAAVKGHDAADGAPAGAAEALVVNAYKPWPASLTKSLTKELSTECTFRYYVLDEREFDNYREKAADYSPLPISGGKKRGRRNSHQVTAEGRLLASTASLG